MHFLNITKLHFDHYPHFKKYYGRGFSMQMLQDYGHTKILGTIKVNSKIDYLALKKVSNPNY